ncbi:metallophosphoesterase family protein [Gloeobacter violaceus]|uniref:Glr0056 protein n=1 Tax=Gloeobacter violaceus (strain ATCC 29082 / PCC 7421) TaxID=251221 RepID=Q7NPJ9_GLOVI|nr:metallophosphoesterase [Gloeobacter violaceus]BAC87997.1 glr0056 [Gloeobacter violaceus PCC 7421]
MSIVRRRLLLLGGFSLGAVGVGVAAARLWPAGGARPTTTPGADNAQAALPRPVGPQGMFAPPRGDVRLVVISDLNSYYGSVEYEPQVTRAIALIPGWKPDIVLCGGDLVAGQSPSLKRERLLAMWAAYDRLIGAPLRKARLPFGFTVGNHDASCERAIRGNYLYKLERDVTAGYWRDPAHDSGLAFIDRGEFPFYYTFAANDIFYLVWDASCARIPAEQLAWAEKALASAPAQNAKLRVAIGHLPLYAVAVGRDEPGEILDNAEKLRMLLERYRVHTYISGHHHSYYPAYRGQLQLLHAGALGSGPRPLIDGNLRPWHPLTVIDIDMATLATTYTTYDMETLKVFDIARLPRMLSGPTGAVFRRDVRWEDLSAAERKRCLDQLGEKGCR